MCGLTHPGTQCKGRSLGGNWIICERASFANLKAFARGTRTLWDFLWGQRCQFYILPLQPKFKTSLKIVCHPQHYFSASLNLPAYPAANTLALHAKAVDMPHLQCPPAASLTPVGKHSLQGMPLDHLALVAGGACISTPNYSNWNAFWAGYCPQGTTQIADWSTHRVSL